MRSSIVIVSRDRKEALRKTLDVLSGYIDFSQDEILVFLDACTDGSDELAKEYPQLQWHTSALPLGASRARRKLYPSAKGQLLIGFDDDAHPLQPDFIQLAQNYFDREPGLAILAFEEIKGVFASDVQALAQSKTESQDRLAAEFVGCGFAIRRESYQATDGFPDWVDIYGEEACLSLEILEKGWDILYTPSIKVNHRVDTSSRLAQGRNYFRFGKQLRNETFFYLVYYPRPLKKILRLYWHNLKKYALKDNRYWRIYFSVIFRVLFALPRILKFRKPVSPETIRKREKLS